MDSREAGETCFLSRNRAGDHFGGTLLHPLTMDDSSASSGRYLLSTGLPEPRTQAGNQLPEAEKETGNHKEGVGSLGLKVSTDVLSERGCCLSTCWPSVCPIQVPRTC